MYLVFILILVGFVLLYFGAEFLVAGAERIAINLSIPKAIVGVVLVAFGTSAPELFVNIICSVRGETSFALSNISGSNLTNLCIGFGCIGLLFPTIIPIKEFKVDLIYFLSAPLVIVVTMLICRLEYVPVWSSIYLFILLISYIIFAIKRFKENEDKNKFDLFDSVKGLLFFVLGIIMLYYGGEFVVSNCLIIGEEFKIDPSILGLTVVAMGTSIPDVMASVVAAKKGENQIAIGNLIGSNIFNIYVVLSSTLVLSQSNLKVVTVIFFDYLLVFLLSTIFVSMAWKRKKIDFLISIILLIPFITYYVLRIIKFF